MGDVTGFVNGYENFMEKYSHPTTKKWFLMGSPVPLLLILVTYVYFCKYAGPKFMRDRKPYDLRRIIFVYNIAQVLISVYIVVTGTPYWLGGIYNLSCEPVGDRRDVQQTVYLYFLCKIVELLDTVFFVLRKKSNQISYLHIYHHTLMPVCGWIGTNFLPGGHGTLLGYINSFIHIIMYAYYLVSALGPEYQKYLWWKKYLTSMQLVQFAMIFVHNFQVLFRSCEYPKFINVLLTTQAAYFMYLFGCFYYNSYVRNKRKDSEGKIQKNSTEKIRTNGFVCAGLPNGLFDQKKTKAT